VQFDSWMAAKPLRDRIVGKDLRGTENQIREHWNIEMPEADRRKSEAAS
jgi:hypothetical protein